MAYTPLDPAKLQSGKPVTTDVKQQIKANEDDLDSRLSNVEVDTAGGEAPLEFDIIGPYQGLVSSGVLYSRLTFNIKILGARLFVIESGTSGTTEVDLLAETSPDSDTYVSIFSTRPSVPDTDGDRAFSSNAVISNDTISSGTMLRFDITQTQVGAKDLKLIIEYEKG